MPAGSFPQRSAPKSRCCSGCLRGGWRESAGPWARPSILSSMRSEMCGWFAVLVIAALVGAGCNGTRRPPPCAPAVGQLSVHQAPQAKPATDIAVVGWLWAYRPSDCHCPPDVPCAYCPPTSAVFGDRPPPAAVSTAPPGASPPPRTLTVDTDSVAWQPRVGVKYVIYGSINSDSEMWAKRILPACR